MSFKSGLCPLRIKKGMGELVRKNRDTKMYPFFVSIYVFNLILEFIVIIVLWLSFLNSYLDFTTGEHSDARALPDASVVSDMGYKFKIAGMCKKYSYIYLLSFVPP